MPLYAYSCYVMLKIWFSSIGAGIDCESGMAKVHMIRTYGYYAYEESFYVYQGSTTTGTAAYSLAGGSGNKDEDVCFPTGLITIVLKDTWGDGWSSNSYLYLSIEGIDLGTFHLSSGSQATSTLTIPSVITKASGWKYTSSAQTGTSWTTQAVTWEEMTSFPEVSTTTRYFRKTLTGVNTDTNFHMILKIATNAGFVLYINGQVANVWNMPETYTASTPALSSTEDVVFRTVSVLTKYFVTASTVELAVEMHATTATTSGAEPFDAAILLMAINNLRRIDSDGSHVAVPPKSDSEGSAKIYDNNVLTKWLDSVSSLTTTWTFDDGRREVINSYAISAANDMPTRDPSAWTLYGSNNGEDFYVLDKRSGMSFTSRYQTKTFVINNYIPFNKYKLVVTENSGATDGIQFSEFNLMISNQPIVPIGLSYPQTSYTFSKNIDDVSIIPTLVGFVDLAITGTLPAGLTFDTATGTISGVPSAGMDATTYTVSGKYMGNNQVYTTTLTLTILACELPTKVYLQMTKTNPLTAETFQIINSNDEVVFTGGYSDDGVYSGSICLPVGIYTVKMLNTAGTPWDVNSKLTLKTSIDDVEYTLSKSTLQENTEATFQISLTYPMPSLFANNNVKYLMGSVPDNWYTTSFDASSWTTLSSANRPAASSTVQLYRTTFTVSSLTGFHGFVLDVKAQAGVVVYLNGNEIYRVFLPDGPITATTTPRGGQVTSYWRSITGKVGALVQGQNTLAIGIVIHSVSTSPVTYDAMLRLMTETVEYPRYWDFTIASPIENVNNLFDLNANTRVRSGKASSNFVMTFANNRAELFNEYCIVTHDETPAEDPRDWSIYGSNDGETFDLLKAEANVYFEGRSTPYCFYMPSVNKAYSIFKVEFTNNAETSNFIALSQFNLYLEDLEHATVPDLSFTPSTLVGYTGASFPEVAASSLYYTSFTINPALPEGLTLNTNTGGIHGIYNQPFEGTFTVSAINHLGETKSTTITVKVQLCSGDKTQFSLVFHLESGADKLSFDLKDLTSGQIVETRPRLASYSTFTIPMCHAAGKYALVLKKTDTTGWGANRVNVVLADGAILLTESLAAGVTSKEYNFNVKYNVEPLYSEWSYLVTGDAAPEGWNTLTGAPTTWEKATPGNFPVATGVTQYYFKKFTVSEMEDFSGVEISAISKAGLIVYLNGVEISRLNMPEYSDHTTHSTLEEAVASTHIVGDIVLDGKLKDGENIVAFELHRYIKNEKVNTFDGSVILIMDNMYMVKDGVGTTNPAASGDEGSDKAFDNNSDTKFFSYGVCIGVQLTWTYNNQRREPINNYGLVSAGDCNTRHPSSWILEGSNDGAAWLQLHVAQNVMFTEYYQQKRFDFFNERAFNQYRVTTTACDNEAITPNQNCGSDHMQLADFYLFSKRVVPDCARDGDFPPAMNGDLSYADCPDYYTGYRYRLCSNGQLGNETSLCTAMKPQGIVFDSTEYNLFRGKPVSITPKVMAAKARVFSFPTLPDGLTMDEATGAITGTPTAVQESKKYTISVTNESGSISTAIAMTITEPPVNWILIIIIAIVGIILVVGIIVAIVMAVKSKKAKPAAKNSKSAKGSKNMPKKPSTSKAKSNVVV